MPVVSDDADGMWPAVAAGSGTPSRAIAAYKRFTIWAVGHDTWPGTVEPDDLVQWALDEKAGGNKHWRQDYQRLVSVWETLAGTDRLTPMKFASLPRPVNERYARPVEKWPRHLRREWERMCNAASAPLRKGGMRPWRETTRCRYEQDLCRVLGWLAVEEEDFGLTGHTWASLLTADRCREFINWLVARNGKRARMTYAILAERSGITKQTLHTIGRSDEYTAALELIEKLCVAIDVTPPKPKRARNKTRPR